MSSEQDKTVSLRSKIEKVIVNGALSEDDQRDINQTALQTSMDAEDRTAIEILTEMIRQGRISLT
jgi:hypothetical protein